MLMSLAYQETTLVPMSLAHLVTTSVFLFPFVSLVCYSFSMTGSIFLLVTYSLLKDLRTLPNRPLMSLSLAFLVGDLSILLGSSALVFQFRAPCVVAAILLHYFFLA